MRAHIGDKRFEIRFEDSDYSTGNINGKDFDFDLVRDGNHIHVLHNGKSHSAELIELNKETKSALIKVNGNSYEIALKDKFDDLLEELGMDHLTDVQAEDLKAPMPGLVMSISAKVGDEIKQGDALLILEAMKMENVLKSHCDGTIKEICVEAGAAVEKNELLITFE